MSQLQEEISTYAKLVNTLPVSLLPVDISDQRLIVDIRSNIHRLTALEDTRIVSEVRMIDTLWQQKILLAISDGHVCDPPIYPSDEPRSKWWFWIERLSELTPDERATI